MRAILHVDMDAFFASVEQREHPELRGKPLIVGGSSRRGVVCAASYEARPFGVRSAMPMAKALRLCAHAIVVPPRHSVYAAVSREVFAIFKRFTPLVEGLSLDEAFLDVTHSRALFGDEVSIAERIRAAIRSEQALTASAGVAQSKFVAKIASDVNKPDGITVVRESEIRAFLDPLPIERMWGVGARTAERLRRSGFLTFRDLAGADPAKLHALLGSWGDSVARLSRGEDEREVVPDRDAKSVGSEETYEHDLVSDEELLPHLLEQSSRVAARLLEQQLAGTVVAVKLKFADFSVRTRQLELAEPIWDTDAIYGAAKRLLPRFRRGRKPVRLTGVAVSGLRRGAPARTLFEEPKSEKRKTLERVRADLRKRFGQDVVTRAALVRREPPDSGT